MTNKEKFIEVFGDNPKRHYITKLWEDEEYVPPTIIEADKIEIEKEEPCEDAISRQALIEKATSWDKHFADSERCVSLTDIQNAPSVTPKQKIGRWIVKEGFDGDEYYDCSECGESFCLIDGTPTDNLYNYCPNCGAKLTELKPS